VRGAVGGVGPPTRRASTSRSSVGESQSRRACGWDGPSARRSTQRPGCGSRSRRRPHPCSRIPRTPRPACSAGGGGTRSTAAAASCTWRSREGRRSGRAGSKGRSAPPSTQRTGCWCRSRRYPLRPLRDRGRGGRRGGSELPDPFRPHRCAPSAATTRRTSGGASMAPRTTSSARAVRPSRAWTTSLPLTLAGTARGGSPRGPRGSSRTSARTTGTSPSSSLASPIRTGEARPSASARQPGGPAALVACP